jgi:hypothetical protein
MAQFLPADDHLPIRMIEPDNGIDFQLAQLYALLACETIDVVPVPPDGSQIMIVDGEGKLTGKPRNERATRLVAFPSVGEAVATILTLEQMGIRVIHLGEPLTDLSVETDWIAGDALVCRDDELL